jgi:hypothetical protein
MFEEKHFYEWDVEINNCTQFFPVFFLFEPIRFTVCSKKKSRRNMGSNYSTSNSGKVLYKKGNYT